MPKTVDVPHFLHPIPRTPSRLAVWNARLLIAAVVLIMCLVSMLALHKAGPEAQAMAAGEGMLISGAR